MITTRDYKVIDFLTDFKIARTSTIQELFYPTYRVATQRLNQLANSGVIQRERGSVSLEYCYYINKPKQFRHALILTDFYRELHKIADIKKFIPEPTLGSIRPDAVVGYVLNGESYVSLVEVEISNKGFDNIKYEKFNWESFFDWEPEIIVITNKRCECKRYKIRKIDLELNLAPLKDS